MSSDSGVIVTSMCGEWSGLPKIWLWIFPAELVTIDDMAMRQSSGTIPSLLSLPLRLLVPTEACAIYAIWAINRRLAVGS